jgi:hypothetical protein
MKNGVLQNLQREKSIGASWSETTVPETISATNMAFPVIFYASILVRLTSIVLLS